MGIWLEHRFRFSGSGGSLIFRVSNKVSGAATGPGPPFQE